MKVCACCGCEIITDGDRCPRCNGLKVDDTVIKEIKHISVDEAFVNAMVELHEKDPIEYQLKIHQFKNGGQQQEQKSVDKKPVPRCPRCRSASITAGQRGYSFFWGFIGSGNTVNRCSNCGYKWKPNNSKK